MAEYHAMFKCRLCGERYWNGTVTTDRDLVFRETILRLLGVKTTTPMTPDLMEPHKCDGYLFDGSIGVADFLGWEEKKEADGS